METEQQPRGETVTISEEGTYVLSGTLSDGQLIINAPKEAKTISSFNGVSITNTSGPVCQYPASRESESPTLADNKTNNLKDGENYSLLKMKQNPTQHYTAKKFND